MDIRLSDKRCEEIKEQVVNLFEKYNIHCVPINGFEIANKMGIKVIPYSSKIEKTREWCFRESEDGFSVFKDNKWHIFYNDEKSLGELTIQCYMKLDILYLIIQKIVNWQRRKLNFLPNMPLYRQFLYTN